MRVTSRVLCQGEKGRDSPHFVFVGEDGEEDAVHGGAVLKDAHGRVLRRTSRKRRSMALVVRTALRSARVL